MDVSDFPLGLDTSVVLRLLTGEPAAQAEVAIQQVTAKADAGRPCLVSDLVVTEAYFALHSHYKVPKSEALATLLCFLESPLVQPEGAAIEALRSTLDSTSKPGFVDRLIHLQYSPARLVTFEKAASKLPSCVLLDSP